MHNIVIIIMTYRYNCHYLHSISLLLKYYTGLQNRSIYITISLIKFNKTI